jgi:hypothetical protein
MLSVANKPITLSVFILDVVMLCVSMLSVANKPITLSAIMLDVIMLSVVMLSVVAPQFTSVKNFI